MKRFVAGVAVVVTVVGGAIGVAAQSGGIATPRNRAVKPTFDIVATNITTDANTAVFSMQTAGAAGATKPSKTGKLAGAKVFSYVWPTTLDPYEVGFDHKAGILAFAVTAHPDFDDTPLFDENGNRNRADDGNVWHSHWVVLAPDDACGTGSLKVVDIAEGARPRLPKTWPGLAILIDSPGWSPVFKGNTVDVRVPFDDVTALAASTFDGVTAGLQVNASLHAPLLCVANVFKVASGNLSLPGKVNG
jgi:hypothetical protein